MKYILVFITVIISSNTVFAFDIDIGRSPEIAGRNALFLYAGPSPLFFDNPASIGLPLELRLDWMLPINLPISTGLFIETPNPNLKNFGTRLAFHIDIGSQKADLYIVHVFNWGFVRNSLLQEYGDTPVPLHFYDFRAGFRRLFTSFFGLGIETAFHLKGLHFLAFVKLY